MGVGGALLYGVQGHLLQQLAGLPHPPQLGLQQDAGPGLQGAALLLRRVGHELVYLLQRRHCIAGHVLAAQGLLQLLQQQQQQPDSLFGVMRLSNNEVLEHD